MQAIGLPPLRPVGLHFCPEQALIKVLYDPASKHEEISVSAAQLGAFLVSYCIGTRIPIPRLADKTAHISANSVVLALKVQYAEAPAR